MSRSAVELAERSNSHRALREMIGRVLRAEYDISHPLPDQLLSLLQRLERNEEKSSAVAVVPDRIKRVFMDAHKNRSCMALLLSHLCENKAILQEAVGVVRENVARSRRSRTMRSQADRAGTVLECQA